MTHRAGRWWDRPIAAWGLPIAAVLLLLIGWEAWVRLRDTPAWLLPPPSAVARALVDDRALLLRHGWVTLREVLAGLAAAIVAGVLLGAALDASPLLQRALYPILIASQTIPIVAIAPLLLIWFGYGLLPKVLVTALIAFFPIAVTWADGLRGADPEALSLVRAYGASRWTAFRLVKAPGALPALFSGLRVGVAVSVIGAVFGELVGSSAGLGYLMTRSTASFQTSRVFAAILVLSAMAFALFLIVAIAERLALPWRRGSSPKRVVEGRMDRDRSGRI